VAVHQNPFVPNRNVYDLVEPQSTVPYKTHYNLDVILQSRAVNKCVIETGTKKKLSLGHWKDGKLIFGKFIRNPETGKRRATNRQKHREKPIFKGYNLLEYKNAFNCSWEIMLTILNDFMDIPITIANLRERLIKEYSKLFSTEKRVQIYEILREEGKRDQITALLGGTSIANIITIENYYLTLFDIFIISKIYKLPCIVLCRTHIPTFGKQMASFIETKSEYAYYIFSGRYASVNSNVSPVYGLISKNDSIRIPNVYISSYDTFTSNNVTTMNEFVDIMKSRRSPNQKNRKKLDELLRQGLTIVK
jgi:hypothetical protein